MKKKSRKTKSIILLVVALGVILFTSACQQPAKEDTAPTTVDKPASPEPAEAEHEPDELADADAEPADSDAEPTEDATEAAEAVESEAADTAEPADTAAETSGDTADTADTADQPGDFQAYEIIPGDDVYQRIIGKSYVENPYIGLEDLRYLTIPHYDFNHNIVLGEMIVNQDIAEDVLSIFRVLFDSEYEIESMRLIDDFWAGDGPSSDDASIAANNSSAFCYRVITGGSALSNHAYGRAIDINPKQNPYYTIYNGEYGDLYEWDWDYIDRDSGLPHMILKGDICESTFAAYGFIWGGDWANPKDYQHFEK